MRVSLRGEGRMDNKLLRPGETVDDIENIDARPQLTIKQVREILNQPKGITFKEWYQKYKGNAG